MVDFNKLEEKAKAMSIKELRYAMKDCYRAAQAIATHNQKRANDYLDELYTYESELIKRRKQ